MEDLNDFRLFQINGREEKKNSEIELKEINSINANILKNNRFKR